jgi:peptidoglycan hydrolase CwlO-like protein
MTKSKVITFFVLISVFLSIFAVNAKAFDCLTLSSTSSEKDRSYCKNELAQIEAQLAELLQKQKEQQKQTGTLKGDVDYLTSQINALKAKIKARNLAIAQLKVNITEKVQALHSLSQKIEREHESLAQLLRNTNEFDNGNLVNLVLSNESISNFYSDLESYNSIKKAVKNSVDIINGVKVETEVAKTDLEKKQDAETDAKAELESAQKKVAQSEAEKKQLLAISKQTETAYQLLAAEKKAKADKIRAALFPLAGTSTKIDFGTALLYAKEAQKLTGIEPAFLLAILTQESNLGSNVGQCYLTNQATGAGVGKNTGTPFANVMKPMGMPGRKGDVEDFLRITSKLGLVWNQTAVSCPIAGVAGYGGAMGPAQFIPTTWTLFEGRLKNLLGYDANPWAPKDAFLASSMYLTDLGAIGASASAQMKGACKYYGTGLNQIYNSKTGKYETVKSGTGTSCYYGRSTMGHKVTIQANIDLLSQ